MWTSGRTLPLVYMIVLPQALLGFQNWTCFLCRDRPVVVA
ncbi:hypothetical protein EV132_10310 [Rhizobium sullae]|uniref:Uncharacterized protein n=1 Tax=Rhizobium sullae TaxID=50338 RepID=A0A4R3QAW7_RHISU|nr:hypothetical protein EV132_10310 [Rhizobium sullae]